MNDPIRDELRGAWHRISRQNGWSLASDERLFLAQALAEFGRLKEDQPLSRRAQVAVKCAYSALLYQGLFDRDDVAAQEIRQAMFRRARQRGWSEAEAEDLAQETIARVWRKRSAIHSAQGLLAFAFYMLLTVERGYRTQVGREAQIGARVEGGQEELLDPTELAADVEQRIMSETITSQIEAAVPNTLQRVVLMRTVIFGEKPREIARELDLPLPRTRLAKSRALERLRNDPTFGDLLDDLVESG